MSHYQWLTRSEADGFFIDESTDELGVCFDAQPMSGRTFVLTPKFEEQAKPDRLRLGKKLIKIGRGTVKPWGAAVLTADLVLSGRCGALYGKDERYLDWGGFMALIPGQ